MKLIRIAAFTLASVTALSACGKSDNGAAARGPAAAGNGGTPAAQGAAGTSGGMSGMSGMSDMASGDSAMRDSMQAHLRTTASMSPAQMQGALAAHRQMVANMLSRMNADMRSMNMPADQRWSATVDSIRADLVGMPEMSSAELARAFPAHRARVERLMQMHGAMMQPGNTH